MSYWVEQFGFGVFVRVEDLFDFAFLDEAFEFGPEGGHGWISG